MLKTKWLMKLKIVDYSLEGKLSCHKEREHNHHSGEFKEHFNAKTFLNEIGTSAIPKGNKRYYTCLYSTTKREHKVKSLRQIQVSLSDPERGIFWKK